MFPCLGQSVRETELVSLHQLTAPPVTMSTSGCALRCLFPCLGQSVRETELVSLHRLTAPTVTMSTSGCALRCLFPCLGQSVRETELVSLHQLTAPTVTMSTSGCALRCLYLLYWHYLTCPYPSARTHSKGYCIYSIYLWGSYDKPTEPSVTMSRSGCPNHVLVTCHS